MKNMLLALLQWPRTEAEISLRYAYMGFLDGSVIKNSPATQET